MAGVLRNCGAVQTSGSAISVLIVGSSEICEKIAEALHLTSKQLSSRVIVHQCESIVQVTRPGANLSIDFIVFAIDGQVTQSISELEINVNSIDKNYIVSGAVCLVHCHSATGTFGMTYHRARETAKKYCIRQFLNANVQDNKNCLLLAERLLNLAEGVLGLKSGLPACNF